MIGLINGGLDGASMAPKQVVNRLAVPVKRFDYAALDARAPEKNFAPTRYAGPTIKLSQAGQEFLRVWNSWLV